MLGGQFVVAPQAGEDVVLPLLVAARVVDDPVPLGRDVRERLGGRWPEHVDVHCVHLVDRVAPGGQVDRRGGVEHHADAAVRVRAAITEAVLHCFHGMPDGMAVDEVHQHRFTPHAPTLRTRASGFPLRLQAAGHAPTVPSVGAEVG